MSAGSGTSNSGPQSELVHHDPRQLWFQIAEIFNERTYVQHGVDVTRGDVVFDLGANVGVAATFFASVCHARRVYSFEPIEPIFELLRENTKPYPGCISKMRAIGNRSGSHEITYYPNADAMSGLYAEPDRDASLVDRVLRNRGVADDERRDQLHGRYRPVRLRCDMSTLSEVIDESGEASIDLLKIDVERSELDVLRGLSDEDWPKVRQIVAEVHDEADRVAQFDRILVDWGFVTTWDQAVNMRGTGVWVVYAKRPAS